MVTIAESLAQWAHGYRPDAADLALAERSLLDTLAAALAAREHDVATLASVLPDAARWAAVGHVLDFDDVQVETSSHVSVVIVSSVLAVGGDARAYLAGAGVMTRLGTLLGWPHYSAGWHITCTAGAPAAAVAAGTALGLTPHQLATAMALALPAAGGVQAAFGTHGKSLQVGFAAEAGVRAARLAQAGATADPRALDQWLTLLGGVGGLPDSGGPAVPGGLAIKLHPCCYAMQRPIAAIRELREALGGLDPAEVARVVVTTPEAGMQPLRHDRPRTGLESKFSMPYAVTTALLDEFPDFDSFTDAAVNRPEAQRLVAAVETVRTPGGDDLLTGEVDIRLELSDGTTVRTSLAQPPGSPLRAPTPAELDAKFAACGADIPALLAGINWASARALLNKALPAGPLES
ncbi:MmgE/PrpD family protein [Streptomyces albipurpureus]|uniref:MmgE/PrpD family protein n=1 Tax=Streptomyces albipurpureus TaxID=2897419 RepID=A0ABT0UXU6_9ACTN|nr:MmgE/PrpD family protein [Streptomyces sp. CWNU-1]MCM2393394.1 MmgE/PrpD family protein [Streptomyces sp. CWNU-1]